MTQTNMTTIARPYAVAAFEFALNKNALPAWEAMLETASLLSQDPSVQKLLTSPNVTSSQWVSLYCDVLGKQLDAEMKNFIQLLAEYDRLSVLPDIAAQFKSYRAEQEKKLNVLVSSAIPLSESYQQKLIDVLTKRLHRQVMLECEVDPKLLGGAIITAGDTVIDGSVRGKLDRMVKFISESL